MIINPPGNIARSGMQLLSDYRKRHNLTQLDVAEKMGVPPSRVDYLETRDIEVMRLHMLERYVTALGGKLVVNIEFPEDKIVGESDVFDVDLVYYWNRGNGQGRSETRTAQLVVHAIDEEEALSKAKETLAERLVGAKIINAKSQLVVTSGSTMPIV